MCCDLYQDIMEYIFAYLPLKLSSTLIVVIEFPFAKCGTFEHGVNCDHILTLQDEANADGKTSQIASKSFQIILPWSVTYVDRPCDFVARRLK